VSTAGDRATASSAHFVEAAVWAGCALLSVWALEGTAEASFPARDRAMLGEAVLLGTAVLFAFLAIRRGAAAERARARDVAGAPLVVLVRLISGVPTFVFWLVVAAAGFAA
jgi:hypothetical protein